MYYNVSILLIEKKMYFYLFNFYNPPKTKSIYTRLILIGLLPKTEIKDEIEYPDVGQNKYISGISGLIQERIMWNIGMTLMKKFFTSKKTEYLRIAWKKMRLETVLPATPCS